MTDKLKQLPELAVLAALTLAGLIFFMATDPGKLPPIMLMVGFAILGGIIYSGLRLAGRLSGLQERFGRERYGLLLFAATALPVILIAMQSLGQLTARDTVTFAVLFLAGCLYISRSPA